MKRDSGKPNETGRQELSDRDRQNELRVSAAELKRSLGKRYLGCRVDNFVITGDKMEDKKKVIEKLKQYGKNLSAHVEAGEGLVLYGKQGTGKDHLMAAMLMHASREGFTVKLVNGTMMYRGVTETWGTDSKESDRLKELVKPDILAISDPLPPTGELKDYQTTFLYSVVDERYRQLKPTWVTVNFFGADDAANKLSSQVADRMRDGAFALYFEWTSYRKSLQT